MADEPCFAELTDFAIDPTSVRLLPRPFCRNFMVVVLGKVDPASSGPVTLGVVRPDNRAVIREASQRLARPVDVVRLNLYEVDRALRIGFEGASPVTGQGDLPRIPLSLPRPQPDANATELLSDLLAQAVRLRASDIHLETFHEDVDVRHRVDGILQQSFTHISPSSVGEVINRLKVLCNLDVAERRRPQDGRLRCAFSEGDRTTVVDFRVSIVPSPAGEDAVIRVLDPDLGLLTVRELGMSRAVEEEFARLLANPEGLLLVTGPTGSGKTTTLYSALAHMSSQQRKIITAEDPIEYYLDRLNQKQVSAQMSMHDLLRAMLRQNPDVMLIGELRDRESASTATDAATTGHLVLGTLHTSDAIGVVLRLRGIGIDDMDIASTLLASVGQRLVRRCCPECIEAGAPSAEQSRLFGRLLDGTSPMAGRGCPRCNGSGYKGRVGVYELLVVDEQLQDLIASGAPRHELRQWTARRGLQTLVHDALDKVRARLTTLDELVRVLPYRQIVQARTDLEGTSGSSTPLDLGG